MATYVNGGADAEVAFDRLVERHAGFVYAICFRYFGNAPDAEDAAQETFIALLRRAATFRGSARFSTWLYRVATNVCNDIARRRARRPRAEGTDVARLIDRAAPDDPLAARELSLELQKALEHLDAETRAAIVLHDVHGLPYADIAARLDVPTGTVKSRIHRGHARLAAFLRTSSSPPIAVAEIPDHPEPLRPPGHPRR